MINDIVKGIGKAIRDEFESDYNIHTEEVKQGLKEPCFFIYVLNPQYEQVLGKRYLISCNCMVQYITEGGREECNNVAERLFDCLELIIVSGDIVRGTNMSYEVVDGILNFNVSYKIYVYKNIVDEINMEELKQIREV